MTEERRTNQRRELDRLLLSMFDEFQTLRKIVEGYQRTVDTHIEEVLVFSRRMSEINRMIRDTNMHLTSLAHRCDTIESKLMKAIEES